MEYLESKEKVAFLLCLFVSISLLLFTVFSYFLSSSEAKMLVPLVGLSLAILSFALRPKMFFVPLQEALMVNMPTIYVTRVHCQIIQGIAVLFMMFGGLL